MFVKNKKNTVDIYNSDIITLKAGHRELDITGWQLFDLPIGGTIGIIDGAYSHFIFVNEIDIKRKRCVVTMSKRNIDNPSYSNIIKITYNIKD